MSHQPPQLAPVKRPELISPHRCVDVVHGTPEQLVTVRLALTHGANYNDPAYFEMAGYEQKRGQA